MLAITAFYEDPLTLFATGLVLLIMFFWYFATDVERRKRNIGSVLTIGICALCTLAMLPFKERLRGGIDILGGSSFSLRIQPKLDENENPLPITIEQAEQAISVIEKRLDASGGQNAVIVRQGEDGILVQMPGVKPGDSDRIRAILEKVAKLELREVSPRNDELGPDRRSLAERVASGDEIIPGYRAYKLKGKDEDGNEFTRDILLNRRAALGGGDISLATPSPQQADAVAITLNGPGTDKMIALTQNMRKGIDRIAIVLDGEVISAPVVNQTPLGKNFIIEGLREPGEVQNLANALMNPLENPLKVEEFRNISPLYGKAVIEQGMWAGAIGLSITAIFILIYYRTAGLIALIGLTVNGVILFGIMAMFGFIFTLPGIAGMILTIGMAVDANVIIYERLREEIESGKSLKNAIESAYDKAFSAIFDANITSLITAIILFWLANSTVKGFAVTLTIGLLASMFSAILVTRVLFRWGIDFKLLQKVSSLNLIRASGIDFLGKRRQAAIFSSILFLLCLVGGVLHKNDAFGIDFTGGTMLEFQLGKEVEIPLGEIETALSQINLTKAAFPQEQSNPATGTLLSIRCDTADSQNIVNKLREAIPALAAKNEASGEYLIDASKQEVDALLGGTFLKQSFMALFLGLVGIFIYITLRFELAFAIGGFVAIIHDVIITLGIIILLGGELSLIHVGAILTVAGYSINDTIVIFDRIRENLLLRGGSVKDIMNEAINATLSRTILTSATTIVTVAILSLFGGSSLRDFSVMILVGLIVGTYSSVFVATPIVLWWSRRKGGDLRKDILATEMAAVDAISEKA